MKFQQVINIHKKNTVKRINVAFNTTTDMKTSVACLYYVVRFSNYQNKNMKEKMIIMYMHVCVRETKWLRKIWAFALRTIFIR